MTVAELFTAWHENRRNIVKPLTYMDYENLYKLYAMGHLSHKQVNRLTTVELNTYVDELLAHGGQHQQGYKGVSLKGLKKRAEIIKKLKAELPLEEFKGVIEYGSPTMTELEHN